ncbi:hypothetical protein B9Z19DRAFT_1121377 [Tuber borchii]|uniref:Uncharacterized protein n=1 Tax=Tuber borchii TaxID=42251 RepID=A0A2T7A2N5_TUBBO|nr:hypothetical protein B9Z19DRAFT_1121377 [Tuber borchii]
MAFTNTLQNVKGNDKDSENNNGGQRSESPKVPVRGRGAWKPTPKPLLPSEVMRLKLEAPKEAEIVRFGVPNFGRRSESEEGDGEEGDEGGPCSGELKAAVGVPVEKELSDASIKMKEPKEALLAENYIQKLDEIPDLGHPKNTEESEEPKEAEAPKRLDKPTEPKTKVKVEEKASGKLKTKPEQIRERKPYKIYESPTTERKPFQMKKKSELPARIQTPTIRVRELSEGPRSPTIASKLKWVTRSPSPTTPERKQQTTPRLTPSGSKSPISPCSRKSTPSPILLSTRTVGGRTPTGSLLSPPSGSSFRRPSPVPRLERGGNASLSRGSSSRRYIPEPPIPIVPQEHILRLANLVECSSEGALEDMFHPLLPEVAPKLKIWDNRMRKEELCPGCRRCAVKFEFVCGDMICGGCFVRLLKESGKGDVRCIACQAVVG